MLSVFLTTMRKCIIFLLLFLAQNAFAQLRYDKLVIKSGETFSLEKSDILVADTLIMEDGSKIILNALKRENYIHTKKLVVGNNCVIEGRGTNGSAGRNGRVGSSPQGPCMNGGNGSDATRGLDGGQGNHLFLYIGTIQTESLRIDLTGGNGGNGGVGGNGGSGGQGTIHCAGGSGGNGGNGGDGGSGGKGGTLTIHCNNCPVDYSWIGSKIIVWFNGGIQGEGGRGGAGGYAGEAPGGKRGRVGSTGSDGTAGVHGSRGGVNFAIE